MKPFKAKSVLLVVALAALSLVVAGCEDLLGTLTGAGVTPGDAADVLLEKPSEVEGLEASAKKGSVELVWDANDKEDLIEEYHVYRMDSYDEEVSQSDDDSWNKIHSTGDDDTTDYVDTDVVNGVTYGYYVVGENSEGEGSRIKAEVVTAKPSAKITEEGEPAPEATDVGTVTGTVTVEEGIDTEGKKVIVAILTGEDEFFDSAVAKLEENGDNGNGAEAIRREENGGGKTYTFSLSAPADEGFAVGSVLDENGNFEPDEGELVAFDNNDGDEYVLEVGEELEVDLFISADFKFVGEGENSITGKIFNQTDKAGPVIVAAFSETSFEPFVHRIENVDANGEAEFSITGLPDGKYEVGAFLDLNDNGFPDEGRFDPSTGKEEPPEPFAFDNNFGALHVITGGEALNIDLFLGAFGGNTALFGVVEYEGPQDKRGRIQVVLIPIGPPPPDDPTQPAPPPPPPLPPFFLNDENSRVVKEETTPERLVVEFELFGMPPGAYEVVASMDINDDKKFDEKDARGRAEFEPGVPHHVHIQEDFFDAFVFIQLRNPLAVGTLDVAQGTSKISGTVYDSLVQGGVKQPIGGMVLHLHSPGSEGGPGMDFAFMRTPVMELRTDASGNYTFSNVADDGYFIGADGFSVQDTGQSYENAGYGVEVKGADAVQDFTLFRTDPRNPSALFGIFAEGVRDATGAIATTEPFGKFDEAGIELIRKDTGAFVAFVSPGDFQSPGIFYDPGSGDYGIFDLGGGDYYVVGEGDGFIPFQKEIKIDPPGGTNSLVTQDILLEHFNLIQSTMASVATVSETASGSGVFTNVSTNTLTWDKVLSPPDAYWSADDYVIFIADAPDLDTATIVVVREVMVSELSASSTPATLDLITNVITLAPITNAELLAHSDPGTNPPASGDLMYWTIFALQGTDPIIVTDPTTGQMDLKGEDIRDRMVGLTINPNAAPDADPFAVPFTVGSGMTMSSTSPPTGPEFAPIAVRVKLNGVETASVPAFSTPVYEWDAVTGAAFYEISITGGEFGGFFFFDSFGEDVTSFNHAPPPPPAFGPPPLNEEGEYRVEIIAWDANFDPIAFGEATFTVTAGAPPPPPDGGGDFPDGGDDFPDGGGDFPDDGGDFPDGGGDFPDGGDGGF